MAVHILLADDDPILLEIAGEYLREVGFSITKVEDGRAALDAACGWRFDAVVTDLVMPNLDGLELIKALRLQAPDTPIIGISSGISGMNADLLLRAARAAGADTVLPKPLTRSKFLATVAEAVERSGLQERRYVDRSSRSPAAG